MEHRYYMGTGGEYKNLHYVNFCKIMRLVGKELTSSIQQKHHFRDGFKYLCSRIDLTKVSKREIRNLFMNTKRFKYCGPITLKLSFEYERIFRALHIILKELNKKIKNLEHKINYLYKIIDNADVGDFILKLHNSFYIKSRNIARNYGPSAEQSITAINIRLQGLK